MFYIIKSCPHFPVFFCRLWAAIKGHTTFGNQLPSCPFEGPFSQDKLFVFWLFIWPSMFWLNPVAGTFASSHFAGNFIIRILKIRKTLLCKLNAETSNFFLTFLAARSSCMGSTVKKKKNQINTRAAKQKSPLYIRNTYTFFLLSPGQRQRQINVV